MAFDAKIDDNMIKVCGRMLSLPSVLYKDGKEPPLAMGGWNLRGVNFAIPVPNAKHGKLGKWGCLRLLDPDPRSQQEGNDRFESSVLEFKKMLQTCGIKTDEPWKKTSGLGKNLEETIRAAHRDWKMEILLVVLPNKNTELYNMIKGFCDRVEGIHTVCVIAAGFYKRNGTYFANVALKFNLKLGGTNHTLKDADTGIVSKGKTMVVGIDVVHPSPGSGKASVASMVANINKDLAQWPVDLRVQLRKGQEMLDKIYEMLSSRLSLWKKHNKSYPENILVYRDGVSESQYQQVLDEELKCMRDASQKLYREASQRSPRFTLIIVGKRHHTRFFPIEQNFASDSNGNPNRGLVVDRGVTEAPNWDFFLQSHNAIKGTARPAHYFVLWDEIFTNIALEADHQTLQPGSLPADRLERLTHSLCYLFSRAAKAVSIPAPVYYADIACERANRYLADSSTGSESATTDNTRMNAGQRERLCSELQEQIKIHENLRNEMFYI